jgi:hypothetical protein
VSKIKLSLQKSKPGKEIKIGKGEDKYKNKKKTTLTKEIMLDGKIKSPLRNKIFNIKTSFLRKKFL